MNFSSPTISRMTRRAAAALALAGAGLLLCAADSTAAAPRTSVIRHPSAPAARPAVHRPVVRTVVTACATPSPVTADGYAAMFAKVDGNVWGAGDTALSVRLPGRAVWLYSDTASGPDPQHWTRFVHNTAITQVSGCLHVSRNGAQVLPNDPDGGYYWIDSAHAINSSSLYILGYQLDPSGTWTGRFRAAQVAVSTAGDLTFVGWIGYQPAPAPSPLVKDGGIMGNSVSYNGTVICDNILTPPTAEYTYSPQLHPELGLASGKTLLSLAVGWAGQPADGHAITWQDMRPIYREVTLP